MATNVNLSYSNFTLTPQAGTFGTIDTSNPTTILRIKNASGAIIVDYTLSSNIVSSNRLIGIEYCGPLSLSGFIDGVTFITVERVDSNNCLIKRWEIDTTFSMLNLKEEIIKYTTGNFYYDVEGMAVEHYHRSFNFALPAGQNYLEMKNTNHVEKGSILFLGPSTDTDNVGATEKVLVDEVLGNRVYIIGSVNYDYVFGDKITFFNNIYLISKIGYAGDTRYGTIFKHNVYSGARLEYTTGGEYARIKGARWSTEVEAIAGINESQLLFIRPYDSYLKWKSMFLNNVQANDGDYFNVYDIVFDEITIYKLMKKATTKNDSGNKVTESWSTYNFQQDTIKSYTHNVAIYTKKQHLISIDSTKIYLQARDQFGVGLKDVAVNLYHDGSDSAAQFDPLDGQAVTDSNGEAVLGYTSGGSYTGPTTIDVRVNKSSSFTGSEYCWNSILIDNKVEFFDQFGNGAMFQYKQNSDGVGGKLTATSFSIDTSAHCYSFFGTPGGNWVYPSSNSSNINTCWPWLQLTPPKEDGPRDNEFNMSCRWTCVTWPGETPQCGDGEGGPRSNYIKQILDFTQVSEKKLRISQPIWFWTYRGVGSGDMEDGIPIDTNLFLLDSEHTLGFSQLKMGKHSYWSDGIHTTDLKTNVNLDQFVFVEDAIPAFWSEKNPRETDIWIRMRPFAFSLNGDTLKFFVREVWTVDDVFYDTGYYDVVEKYGWPPNNNRVTLNYFDAGGGTLGIEFTYDNPDIYHHSALVYVHIEVNDTAAEPNLIYTDYWFKIIPDYKAPYLINENPDREEDQVDLNTNLYFEIKDDGEGIDISTLEVYINSRIVYHSGMSVNPGTVIERISNHHYKVTIDLPSELQYGKDYSVAVRVSDVSENRNILRYSYRFYTRHSELPWFTEFDPKLCKRGMPRFRDVSFIVLGGGSGVDKETIRIQVHDHDRTAESKITPVIYRIS